METLYIIIGAFSSIFIFLLGYSVSGVFTGKKRMDELDSYIRNTDLSIEELERELNEKIDRNVDVLVNNIGALDKDVYAHIDSRLDKLENKFRGDIASGVEVRKIIDTNELLEQRLNRFIETFQNQ